MRAARHVQSMPMGERLDRLEAIGTALDFAIRPHLFSGHGEKVHTARIAIHSALTASPGDREGYIDVLEEIGRRVTGAMGGGV